MPVADGIVESKPVSVLRNTGCSTLVIRRSLIPDEKLTGLKKRCILIDGTIRQTPVTKIEVETPYFSETLLAVCMKEPICDLIMGNFWGAINPLYLGKKVLQQTGTNRQGQSTIRKGRRRRNSNNRRQPDLNLHEPSSESATVRSKMKLLPCTVKDPMNTVVHTERNASIFGNGKPRKSSLVNETKLTVSQSNKDQGQSTDWRKNIGVRSSAIPSVRQVFTHTHTGLSRAG